MASHTRPPNGRYFHISCLARMVPNPVPHMPEIPWREKPGVTYVRRRPARLRTETNKPRIF